MARQFENVWFGPVNRIDVADALPSMTTVPLHAPVPVEMSATINLPRVAPIWRAFAKRGLGASANQGLSTSRTDGVEAFDLPAACTSATFGEFRAPVLPGPSINNLKAGSRFALRFTLSDPAGGLVVDHQPVDCSTLEPTGETPELVDAASINHEGTKYALNWQTEAAWVGSCRRLTLRIPAASDAVAYFLVK